MPDIPLHTDRKDQLSVRAAGLILNIFAQCETETHKHIVHTMFSLWRTVIMPNESDLGNQQALFVNFISKKKKNQGDDVLT